MRRVVPRIITVLLTFALGVGLDLLLRRPTGAPAVEIAPIKINYACVESTTTDDFAQYWLAFRSAVQNEDKTKLFALTCRCEFRWWYWWNVGVRLRTTEEIAAATALKPAPHLGHLVVNDALVFETDEDFMKNYHIIFSPEIRHRILSGKLDKVAEGYYQIRWRDDPNDHSSSYLEFQRVDGVGYKFKGREWEP